jgi:O-antigen ligase
MSGVVGASCKAAVEGFLDTGNAEQRRRAYVEFATVVLSFIVALVLIGFIGKYLWNGVICDLFIFAKPARSLWQIVGLMLFISLIRP